MLTSLHRQRWSLLAKNQNLKGRSIQLFLSTLGKVKFIFITDDCLSISGILPSRSQLRHLSKTHYPCDHLYLGKLRGSSSQEICSF